MWIFLDQLNCSTAEQENEDKTEGHKKLRVFRYSLRRWDKIIAKLKVAEHKLDKQTVLWIIRATLGAIAMPEATTTDITLSTL